jgi:ABC-type polar amino acid transport system ATPase subunit
MEPKIMLLLFDELTIAWPWKWFKCFGISAAIASEISGMTMLVVTHEVGFARVEVADRVSLYDAGRYRRYNACRVFFYPT